MGQYEAKINRAATANASALAQAFGEISKHLKRSTVENIITDLLESLVDFDSMTPYQIDLFKSKFTSEFRKAMNHE